MWGYRHFFWQTHVFGCCSCCSCWCYILTSRTCFMASRLWMVLVFVTKTSNIDEYSSHSKKLRNYSDKIDKIVPKLFGTGQGWLQIGFRFVDSSYPQRTWEHRPPCCQSLPTILKSPLGAKTSGHAISKCAILWEKSWIFIQLRKNIF